MSQLIDELPSDWERYRISETPAPTWTYKHLHLDVEVNVLAMDADEMNPELDTEYVYDISLQWAADVVGAVEGFFDGPGDITTEGDARDWTLALLSQIERQFEPGDTDYVSRAMSATMGEEPIGRKPNRTPNGETCPVCDAPFFQFRGMDTYEQAKNHFEYMDDEDHEDWEISITDES